MSRNKRLSIRMSENEKDSFEINKAKIALMHLPKKIYDGEIVEKAVGHYLEKLKKEGI